jgi:hypothetical protein
LNLADTGASSRTIELDQTGWLPRDHILGQTRFDLLMLLVVSSLAPAAMSPASAAATAASTAAASATTPTAAPSTAAAAATGPSHQDKGIAGVFLVEQMECGETDISHFLFAKHEALIGQGIVGSRDIDIRQRGCGCAARNRKTKSGCTERRQGGAFGYVFLYRSVLVACHGPDPSRRIVKGGKAAPSEIGCAATLGQQIRKPFVGSYSSA